MQSIFWYSQDGRRNATWEPTFYLERTLTKPWDVFAEYGGDYSQRGSPRQIAHFGTAYRIGAGQQVDLHAGIGVSRAAPHHFIGVGYSFRLDRLWGR
jgi:hypothetical protein